MSKQVGVRIMAGFEPGSTVKVHRGGAVGDEVASKKVDKDGSVEVTGLREGERYFLVGTGPDGRERSVNVTGKELDVSFDEMHDRLKATRPIESDREITEGARSTADAKPKTKKQQEARVQKSTEDREGREMVTSQEDLKGPRTDDTREGEDREGRPAQEMVPAQEAPEAAKRAEKESKDEESDTTKSARKTQRAEARKKS
jgi:hypothetical protein